jgi:hypothetical protein
MVPFWVLRLYPGDDLSNGIRVLDDPIPVQVDDRRRVIVC